jgi:hypothetical protein
MTTRVHIVNFGPDVVDITLSDPETKAVNPSGVPSLGSQQSVDLYVHSTQQVTVTERKHT